MAEEMVGWRRPRSFLSAKAARSLEERRRRPSLGMAPEEMRPLRTARRVGFWFLVRERLSPEEAAEKRAG
jgi:hypothetical protein